MQQITVGEFILAFLLAMSIPSAITGFIVWNFERKITARDKKRDEEEKAAQEKLAQSNGLGLSKQEYQQHWWQDVKGTVVLADFSLGVDTDNYTVHTIPTEKDAVKGFVGHMKKIADYQMAVQDIKDAAEKKLKDLMIFKILKSFVVNKTLSHPFPMSGMNVVLHLYSLP